MVTTLAPQDPRAKEMKRLALACIAERDRLDAVNDDEDAYITSRHPIGAHEVEEITASEIRRLFLLATKLEEAALADEYFVKRKLFPNVDFYSGLALTAIGIPTAMFTCLFAVGRGVGWVAHWKEFMEEKTRKIGRPRQLYVGAERRIYPSMEERESRRGGSETTTMHFTEKVHSISMEDDAPQFGYFT